MYNFKMRTLEDYEPYIGPQNVERIRKKADLLQGLHMTNVNSTNVGGGVATILSSLTLLMNSLGVRAGWRVLAGKPEFFEITKHMHNAMQSGDIELTEAKKRLYEEVVFENASRMHLDKHDVVVIHDPQPVGLVARIPHTAPWIWRCHVDMTEPHPGLWKYLRQYIDQYQAVIVSKEEYRHTARPPQHIFMPAIDPFSMINCDMTDEEVDNRLAQYEIPTDLPLVVQVSRFDKWKDPAGVIEAFKIARRKQEATLVLIGNTATDDPEGNEVYESLLSESDDRIIISDLGDDHRLINSLQRKAAVVFQKSIREGFGLTVTEAMWKGTPVIGGDVGGIQNQIDDGSNGYRVNSVEEAADRLVELLKDEGLRTRMGNKARESVKERFLMSRLMEQYFDLFIELSGRGKKAK